MSGLKLSCFLPPVQQPVASVRYVAISATIYNIQDIAQWLDVPSHGVFAFGEEVRPVKLTTLVKGFPTTKTDFLFERRLNDHLRGIILQYSKGRPTLVFCRHVHEAAYTHHSCCFSALRGVAGLSWVLRLVAAFSE